MKRHWCEASPSQLFQRVMKLEGELLAAASLLDMREEQAERYGMPRSLLIAESQQKWRALLDEEPAIPTPEEQAP